MKKIVITFLVCVMLFVTGCGSEIKLDLKKTKDDLKNLTASGFDISYVGEAIDKGDPIFGEMEDFFDYDLKNLNVNSENVERMQFRRNLETHELYMVVKTVKDKESVFKTEMKAYLDNYISGNELKSSYLETTYEGHLIFILSKNNDEVLKRIKTAKAPVYGMLMEVTDETLKDIGGLTNDMVEEYAIKTPLIVQSNCYLIVKPKKGSEKKVKEALDKYMTKVEENFKNYLVDQYELAKNRLETKVGDYYVYIISTDNNKVLETIKANKLK